jgi:tetratricopeptide (TPR) repeat protein
MNSNRSMNALHAVKSAEARFRVPVLLVISNPLDSTLSPIDFQGEIRQLDRTGLPLSIIRLNPPTWLDLQHTLLRGEFSILHFIGHGNEEGIYLEKPDGEADFITSMTLAQVIQEGNLSLVILNTCESWGPGHALANAGVKAIVASKTPLLDSITPDISASLYTSLIGGQQSITNAVSIAQKTASLALGIAGQDLLIPLGSDMNKPIKISDEITEKDLDTWVSFGEPVHNLPWSPIDNFVGRVQELARQIFPLLHDPQHRAVALVGLAGIGKTTLATAAAWRYSWLFPDGVVFVTARDNPTFGLEDIFQGLGQVVKWELFTGEAADREQLALQKLAGSQLLLILDNLDSAAPERLSKIMNFLAHWDTRLGGKILMTMRERLPVCEDIVRDAFLLIDSLDSLSAIMLLKQLTQGGPTKTIVEDEQKLREIADAVYRHPLLIQLTAGLLNGGADWIEFQEALSKLNGPYEAIRKALEQMARRLVTSHSTVPYLLNSWSVFRGGATSEAWESLVQPYLSLLPITKSNIHDGLRLIRQAQLVNRDERGRYYTHPFVGQYLALNIWDGLPPKERREVRENYLRYFLSYLDRSLAQKGPFALLQLEHLNLRHAFELARELEEWEVVKSMAHKLYKFLDVRGYWVEWEKLIETGLIAAEATQDEGAQATFIYYQAELCKRRGLHDEAFQCLAQAEILAKTVGDQSLLGRITLQTGMVLLPKGKPKEARQKLLESVPVLSALKDFTRLAKAYRSLAETAHELGELDEMREFATKSLNIEMRELDGRQDYGIAASEKLLGEMATEAGDFDEAQHMFDRALPILRDSMDASRQLYSELLHAMARLEIKRGNPEKALEFLLDSLEIAKGLGLAHRVSLVERDLSRIRS